MGLGLASCRWVVLMTSGSVAGCNMSKLAARGSSDEATIL